MTDPALAVRTRALTKRYRSASRAALDGLDLALPAAGALALRGPNGSGKSTLLRLLVGLLRPSAGEAWLFGREIGQPEARRVVGYVPDRPAFVPAMRVRELLVLCGGLSGLGGEAVADRCDAVLDAVELATHGGHPIGTLSRGLAQRLALAQALLHQPQLLILDEPLSGLDAPTRAVWLDVLRAQRTRGTALLVATHWPVVFGDLLDDAVHLRDGRQMSPEVAS